MKHYILKIVLLLNFIIMSISLWAYPESPEGGDDPLPDNASPIDTYLCVFFITGTILGLYFIYRKEKRKLVEC